MLNWCHFDRPYLQLLETLTFSCFTFIDFHEKTPTLQRKQDLCYFAVVKIPHCGVLFFFVTLLQRVCGAQDHHLVSGLPSF